MRRCRTAFHSRRRRLPSIIPRLSNFVTNCISIFRPFPKLKNRVSVFYFLPADLDGWYNTQSQWARPGAALAQGRIVQPARIARARSSRAARIGRAKVLPLPRKRKKTAAKRSKNAIDSRRGSPHRPKRSLLLTPVYPRLSRRRRGILHRLANRSRDQMMDGRMANAEDLG